jgi:hypothetical protein
MRHGNCWFESDGVSPKAASQNLVSESMFWQLVSGRVCETISVCWSDMPASVRMTSRKWNVLNYLGRSIMSARATPSWSGASTDLVLASCKSRYQRSRAEAEAHGGHGCTFTSGGSRVIRERDNCVNRRRIGGSGRHSPSPTRARWTVPRAVRRSAGSVTSPAVLGIG